MLMLVQGHCAMHVHVTCTCASYKRLGHAHQQRQQGVVGYSSGQQAGSSQSAAGSSQWAAGSGQQPAACSGQQPPACMSGTALMPLFLNSRSPKARDTSMRPAKGWIST